MSSFQHVIRIEVILYFFILSLSNLVSYTYSTSQFRWATFQVLNIASGNCIGQQKYRTFLSQQNFLVDSALPGSPYFTNSRLREPHREHCFIVQDADDRPFCIHTHLPPHCYLIILIYPHSQMGWAWKWAGRLGKEKSPLSKCRVSLFTWRSHIAYQGHSSGGAVIISPAWGPGPLFIYPIGSCFITSCV